MWGGFESLSWLPLLNLIMINPLVVWFLFQGRPHVTRPTDQYILHFCNENSSFNQNEQSFAITCNEFIILIKNRRCYLGLKLTFSDSLVNVCFILVYLGTYWWRFRCGTWSSVISNVGFIMICDVVAVRILGLDRSTFEKQQSEAAEDEV